MGALSLYAIHALSRRHSAGLIAVFLESNLPMVFHFTLLGLALCFREYRVSRYFYSAAVMNTAFSTTDGENDHGGGGLDNDKPVTEL